MTDFDWVSSPLFIGPEDGERVLNDLRAALQDFVIFPSHAALDAVVLWVAATHAQPAWNCATRLVIKAPEKRCGKSRLLDIIEATCHKPLITVNISPAALVRSIGTEPPTLLLDEADTVFGKKAADNNDDLRGIINAGHQRNRPYIRWDVAARRRRTARPSRWPRWPASATCRRRSRTGPSSCRCAAVVPPKRCSRFAPAVTLRGCTGWANS